MNEEKSQGRLDRYALGDDALGNPIPYLPSKEIIDVTRPLNHAPRPGCPDNDCSGFRVVSRPGRMVSGTIGQD